MNVSDVVAITRPETSSHCFNGPSWLSSVTQSLCVPMYLDVRGCLCAWVLVFISVCSRVFCEWECACVFLGMHVFVRLLFKYACVCRAVSDCASIIWIKNCLVNY